MKVQDIETHGRLILVRIPDTENNTKSRSFRIDDEFYDIVKQYQNLRPPQITTDRFFLNYKNGVCTVHAVGKNKLGGMPKAVAIYLKLDEANLYTGHCFRRTNATVMHSRSVLQQHSRQFHVRQQHHHQSSSSLNKSKRDPGGEDEEDRLCGPLVICEGSVGDAKFDLLPTRTKAIYETCYKGFNRWKKSAKLSGISEAILMEYFEKLSKQYKPGTLWAQYSMLKSTLRIHEQIDISPYRDLTAFIKKQAYGVVAQKSRTLTAEEFKRFLREAPNDQYLLTKVIMTSLYVIVL